MKTSKGQTTNKYTTHTTKPVASVERRTLTMHIHPTTGSEGEICQTYKYNYVTSTFQTMQQGPKVPNHAARHTKRVGRKMWKRIIGLELNVGFNR